MRFLCIPHQGNKIILKQVQQLQNSTLSMRECMEEMTNSARKITETGNTLGDVSGNVRKSIEEIG